MVNRTRPEDKKSMGQWTWNSKRLNEKVIRLGENECWPATNFAQTAHGPLFGVRKNGRAQMTQVCRILYRDWYNEDCEEREITHGCGNKNCLNPSHWEIRDTKIHGPMPTNVSQSTSPIAVKQAKLKPVSSKARRWWDA